MAVLNVWLVSVVILLSAPLHSAPECLLRMQSVVLPLLLRRRASDLIREDTCRDGGPLQSFMMLMKNH